MASSSRTIPHLLEPYLLRGGGRALPTEAADLVIVTGILGASTNWLLLRYLYSFLKQSQQQQQKRPKREAGRDEVGGVEEEDGTTTPPPTSVLLVSFLRDYTFWKEGAGRIGLDLDALTRAGKFSYVDGLSVDLFHSEGYNVGGGSHSGYSSREQQSPSARSPPVSAHAVGRGPPSPARTSPIIPGRQQPGIAVRGGPQGSIQIVGVGSGGGGGSGSSSGNSIKSSEVSSVSSSPFVLTSPSVAQLTQIIGDAIDKLAAAGKDAGNKGRVVLVIDQLDFLLAAAEGAALGDDGISALALRELLLDLREVCVPFKHGWTESSRLANTISVPVDGRYNGPHAVGRPATDR